MDRVRLGAVIDYLDFRIWPIFNLADIGICLGAALVVWGLLREEGRESVRMTEYNTTQLWLVEAEQAGFRLDVFLTERLAQASRSHVQKALAAGAATVNGQGAKANFKLKEGQEVCWREPQPEASSLQPEALPLDIVYEDAHVAVINKARGMVVHPAAGNHHGTLVHALLEHCKDLSGINGEVRPVLCTAWTRIRPVCW